MKLPNHRILRIIQILPSIWVMIALTCLTQSLNADPATRQIDDIRFVPCGDGCVKITISGRGDIAPEVPVFIGNPSRVIIDFKDAILNYNDGRTRRFPIETSDLNSVIVSQYQRHPDVVRVVLNFRAGDEKALLDTISYEVDQGEIVFTYNTGIAEKPSVEELPTDDFGKIVNLLHHRVGPQRDRFTVHGSKDLHEPSVRFAGGGMLLTFKGAHFEIPAQIEGKDFQVPVNGALIDEIQIINQQESSTLFLRVKDSARSYNLDYELKWKDALSFDLDVMRSLTPRDDTAIPEPRPIKTDEGQLRGMVQVLGSSIDTGRSDDMSGASKIVRIQYQPLSIGERFILEVAGDFKPRFQKLRYPDRLIMTAPNTSVIIPQDADNRFQIKIDGAISKLMRVFLADRDGFPESQIQFYYEMTDNEDIQYNCYESDTPNIYHLDIIPIADSAAPGRPSDIDVSTDREYSFSVKPTEPVTDKPVPELEEPVKVKPEPVEKKIEPEPVVEETTDEPVPSLRFELPDEEEYAPVVSIPRADVSYDEPKDEPVSTDDVADPIDTKIETADITPKPLEVAEVSEEIDEPAQPELAPIRVEYISDGKIDKFILVSDDPIDEYSHNELNYPSRLAIELPGRIIDFDNLDTGVTRHVSGHVADNVRIIERHHPTKTSIFYVYLGDNWENVDCTISSSPNKMTIQVASLVPEEIVEPAIADEPVKTPVSDGFVKPDVAKIDRDKPEEPTEHKQVVDIPKAEPVEEKPTEEPPLKEKPEPVVKEPVKEEPADVKVDEPEEPREVGRSFIIERDPVEIPNAPVEEKLDKATEEVVEAKKEPVEAKKEPVEIVTIPVVERIIEEEEPVETIDFTLEPEEPVVKETVKEKPPKEEKVDRKPQVEKETKKSDTFIRLDLDDDPVSDEVKISPTIAKAIDYPLKVGEREIPDNSIVVVDVRDTGLGEIILEVSGRHFPEPDVNWWSYPSRLNLNFEDLGVSLGEESLARWEQDVDTTAISKIRVIQHSGGRVPLAASVEMYLKPGFHRDTLEVQLTSVGNNRLRVALTEPSPIAKPVDEKLIKDVPKIEITDEDFTLSDLDERDEKDKRPTFTPRTGVDPEGRYIKPVPRDPEFVEYDPTTGESLITAVFQNADIEEVLFMIAESAELDISYEARAIRGTISLKVTEKPVSEVFDLIATQGNFRWNMFKGTYIFGSEDFIWDVPGVIQTQVVRLKYADPLRVRQVITQLRIAGPRSITLYQATAIGRGAAGQVPTAQSAVVLKGDANQIQEMMNVIKSLDVPPLLIKVNMKVIEYSSTEDTKFGFDWRLSAMGAAGEAADKGFIAFNLKEKLPEGLTPGDLPMPFQGFRRAGLQEIDLIINFLEDKGDAKILADSSLTVTNGGEGSFFVGEQIPYRSTYQITDFGRVTQRIAQEQVGITLQFRAQASEDGMITLYLDPDIQSLKEITDIGPRTSQKRFSTTIRIPSGQPYAIGGLISESERSSYNKIPFVGDLPLVGKLFQSKRKQQLRSELIIVLTPEIIHDRATQRYSDIYDFDDEEVSFSLY